MYSTKRVCPSEYPSSCKRRSKATVKGTALGFCETMPRRSTFDVVSAITTRCQGAKPMPKTPMNSRRLTEPSSSSDQQLWISNLLLRVSRLSCWSIEQLRAQDPDYRQL